MDKYTKLEQIGKGSFGTVHKIRRKSDGQIMVWKELDYGSMSDKEKQLVVGEVNILRELRHPYILRYHDRIIDKKSTKLYIIVEFCEKGDLRHLIKRAKASRTHVHEDRIWKYFAQILSAIKTCHRRRESDVLKPILHRDIKPANVFLDRYDNAKLGDFGLARSLDSMSKFAYTNVGTPFYMAPEQTNAKKYDERADVWAVGCLLYELAALRPPFHATNQVVLAKKINAGHFERIPNAYSENLYRAIKWMLRVDPSRRPRVEDLESLPEIQSQHAKWASGMKAPTKTVSHERRKSSSVSNELAAREVILSKAEAKLREKEKSFYRAEARLKQKDNALREMTVKLAEREERIAKVEARLREKDVSITKREARLKIREREIENREVSLKHRENLFNKTIYGAHKKTTSEKLLPNSSNSKVPARTLKSEIFTKDSKTSYDTKASVPPAPRTRYQVFSTDVDSSRSTKAFSSEYSSATTALDSAEQKLAMAKKKLELIAKKEPRTALGEVGNTKEYSSNELLWSAKDTIDSLLRR